MLIDSCMTHPIVSWVSSAAVDDFHQARGRSIFDWVGSYEKRSMGEKGPKRSREAAIVHLERGFRRCVTLSDFWLFDFSNFGQAVKVSTWT